MTHRQNDERYIGVGRQLCITMDTDAAGELKRMNKGKVGSPYICPESTIMMLAIVRSLCGLSFRACQGMSEASIGKRNTPHYSAMQKRMKKVRVSTDGGMATARSGRNVLRVAVDGTGLTPNVRGEWIRHVHKTRRGFIRLSMMVDTGIREILAFCVTDEQTCEIKVFESLVEEGLANARIGRGRANGAVGEDSADAAAAAAADGAPAGGTAVVRARQVPRPGRGPATATATAAHRRAVRRQGRCCGPTARTTRAGHLSFAGSAG